MTARVLSKTEWQAYCDRVSKGLVGQRALVEVTGLAIGDQVAAKWVPLIGITYDPKDDVLEVALEGLDHLIYHPREIAVDDAADGFASMEVVDAEQQRQIIRVKEPFMIPPPG